MIEPWLQFLGRLHPTLVHFPIALVLFAALMEFLPFGRPERPSRTAQACIAFAVLTAAAAAGTGWLNAAHESHSRSLAQVLLVHRWLGVSVAALSLLCWILVTIHRFWPRGATLTFYRGSLAACALVVAVEGHLGGTLVHGTGYFVEPFREPPEKAPPESTLDDAQRIYLEQVQPIFETRCYECHGKKEKGDLRLDRIDEVFAGDPENWVVQPGDAEGSKLYELITLPEWDPDHMPQDEPMLPDAELLAIRTWIDQGARYPGDRPPNVNK